MQMLDILAIQLKHSESKPGQNNALQETLSLLGALIPDSRSYQNDTSEFAKNEKAKSLIFSSPTSNPTTNTLTQSILPSLLKTFSQSFDQNIKFSLLQLIEEILLMLPGQILQTYLQPHLFSRFVISTLKSHNYTWIEICLRIIIVLSEKKVTSVNLSLHREGIRDYLVVFGDKAKFYELTGVTVGDKQVDNKANKSEKEQMQCSLPETYEEHRIKEESKKEIETKYMVQTVKEGQEKEGVKEIAKEAKEKEELKDQEKEEKDDETFEEKKTKDSKSSVEEAKEPPAPKDKPKKSKEFVF